MIPKGRSFLIILRLVFFFIYYLFFGFNLIFIYSYSSPPKPLNNSKKQKQKQNKTKQKTTQPVKNIDSPDGINDTQSLVILAEGETKPTQEKYEQLLSKLGEEDKEKGESKGEDPEFLYFIGTKEGGVAERLRGMGKLGDSVVNGGEETKEVVCEGDECRVVKKGGKKANTKVIMFDIPDDGGFYVWGGEGEVTEEVLRGFIKEFKEGKLERQQLGR